MRRRVAPVLAVCALALPLLGCVDRNFTLVTDPPGALVLVDGEEKGKSPVTVPFQWYGTREFRFEMEGYETLVVKEDVKVPAYQYPVLDFVTDVLWPAKIQDHKTFSYALVKLKDTPKDDLLKRAEEMRGDVKKWEETNPTKKHPEGTKDQPQK